MKGVLLFQGLEVVSENTKCGRYDLSGADLEEASLENTRMNKVVLRVADLKKANLNLAELPEGNLREVKIKGAKPKLTFLAPRYFAWGNAVTPAATALAK